MPGRLQALNEASEEPNTDAHNTIKVTLYIKASSFMAVSWDSTLPKRHPKHQHESDVLNVDEEVVIHRGLRYYPSMSIVLGVFYGVRSRSSLEKKGSNMISFSSRKPIVPPPVPFR